MIEKQCCESCGEEIRLNYLTIGTNCVTLLSVKSDNTHKSGEKINNKWFCGVCKKQVEVV